MECKVKDDEVSAALCKSVSNMFDSHLNNFFTNSKKLWNHPWIFWFQNLLHRAASPDAFQLARFNSWDQFFCTFFKTSQTFALEVRFRD